MFSKDDKEEICALRKRIDRVLNAIPLLKQRREMQRDQAPATKKKTRRKQADQETQVMPAIQLSFLWYGDQDRAGDQDQVG